jgi:hypothetical protein
MIMKRSLIIVLALGLIVGLSNLGFAECTTIQDGTLLTTDGRVITTGYDEWGYNYEAHMFNGGYCEAYRNATWCEQYADIDLIMKWNDAWLSNKDCDGNAKLDRHYGYDSYIGSGAWLTNHQSGKVEVNGKLRKWTYFCKIVAVPSDATVTGDYWYTVDGIQIGPVIWGAFAIIQQVSNDPSNGEHGILYNSPAGPGFGIYGAEGE